MLEMMSILYLMLSYVLMINNEMMIIELKLVNFMMIDMNLFLMLDKESMLFLWMVFMISGIIMIYSNYYMMFDKNKVKFNYLMMIFVFSMKLMVMSPNIMMILIGWDGLGLVSYCLVMFYMNYSSSLAAMITVMTNRLGDVGMLMSVVYFLNFYSFNMWEIDIFKSKMLVMVLVLVMLGGMTKSAQIPFSSWLPAAMAAPTPVSALVHSSTLVTAGIYLLMRMGNCFSSMSLISDFLLVVSIMTMIVSGVCAMFENDIKKIIAMSTLSQLGVMMMMISFGYMNMVFFHLISHAFFKAMLFMGAGIMIHNMMGIQDIRVLSNMGEENIFVLMMMLLSSLSLSGIPFLSGFYSKDLILEMVYSQNNSKFLMLLLMFATMCTLMYSFRLIYYLMLINQMKKPVSMSQKESKVMMMMMMILCLVVIFFGSIFSWIYFNSSLIFLQKFTKNMNMMMIVMSLMISLMMSKYKMFEMSNSSITKMWFMEWKLSMLMKVFKNPMKLMMKTMDLGWMESISKEMKNEMNMLMYNMFLKSIKLKTNKMFILMMLIFILMLNI